MKKYNNFIFRLFACLLVVIISLSATLNASAESIKEVPFTSYTYWNVNGSKTAVETKATHSVAKKTDGNELGVGAFSKVQHLYVYENTLYLLDSGNGRIVMLDDKYNVTGEIKNLKYNCQNLDFTGAKGVFVDSSGIYICDTENERIIYLKDGKVKTVILKPQDSTIPKTFSFNPTRLVRDASGYIYLLCDGSYYGMMVFSKELEYFGFFGANAVNTSLSSAIKELILSIFETEEKHNASVKSLPFSLIDLCIDPDGFVAAINGETSGQLRRFGLTGTNTLTVDEDFSTNSSDGYNFADSPVMFKDKTNTYGVYYESKFKALTVDKEGFYYLVDGTHGRIFVYDNKCNVVSVFGGGRGKGAQLGTFVTPTSIAVLNDDLIVSDFDTNEITVFKRTEYGELVMKAQNLTINSKYAQAKPYWEKVIKADKGCQLAYVGLAKAAIKENDYKKAMEYAEIGLEREVYAEAFQKVRNDFISDNFIWISLIAVVLISALVWFISSTRKKKIVLIKNKKLRCVLTFPIHPIENLNEIKYKSQGSLCAGVICLVLFYVSSVLSTLESGFMYNKNNISNFNSILFLIGSVGTVLLWTVANWLVCILFEGKGKLKDIFCTSCYSLIPLIIYNFVFIVLSYVVIPEVNSPFELLNTICYALVAVLLLLSITVVHEFTFFKAIGAAIATIVGMAVVAFVLFAMLTLWQDMLAFVIGLFNEATLR